MDLTFRPILGDKVICTNVELKSYVEASRSDRVFYYRTTACSEFMKVTDLPKESIKNKVL